MQFLADEKRLTNDLFMDYDPNVSGIYTLKSSEFVNRSAEDHPPTLNLTITLTFMKLVNVVEVEEKVQFVFTYMAKYYDNRLTWDPLKYGGIKHIYVPMSKVWLPEVGIADSQEVVKFQYEQVKEVCVSYDGSIFYYFSQFTSVLCALDVYKFPMDQHTCSIGVFYQTYRKEEFEILAIFNELPIPLAILGNGEWQLIKIGTTEYKYNANRTSIKRFQATILRNPAFYITLIIIPAFVINFLSIVALFMNLDDLQGKINIGLTNIMAMTFILAILATDLPKTKSVPLLAIYVIVSLAIIVTSIAVISVLPKLKRKIKQIKIFNSEKVHSTGWAHRFKERMRIEFIFMAIFEIANVINFIILFV